MQAFLDTLKLEMKPIEFHFFNHTKNGDNKLLYENLIGKSTTSKGTTFEFNNVFFIDDSVFIPNNHSKLETLTPILMKQFEHLSKQIHVGKENMKTKTEAMFIPKSLAKTLSKGNMLPQNCHYQTTCTYNSCIASNVSDP